MASIASHIWVSFQVVLNVNELTKMVRKKKRAEPQNSELVMLSSFHRVCMNLFARYALV